MSRGLVIVDYTAYNLGEHRQNRIFQNLPITIGLGTYIKKCVGRYPHILTLLQNSGTTLSFFDGR